MSTADFETILRASRPVPYLVMAGRPPATPQDNANRAWQQLGQKLGFQYLTVRPSEKGECYFTAEPVPSTEEHKRKGG